MKNGIEYRNSFFFRSNPFDNKKEDVNIDALKNKLHLSLNMENQDNEQCNKDKSPSSVKDVKDIILASSKSILEKVLSPTKEKYLSREKVHKSIYLLYKISSCLSPHVSAIYPAVSLFFKSLIRSTD